MILLRFVRRRFSLMLTWLFVVYVIPSRVLGQRICAVVSVLLGAMLPSLFVHSRLGSSKALCSVLTYGWTLQFVFSEFELRGHQLKNDQKLGRMGFSLWDAL